MTDEIVKENTSEPSSPKRRKVWPLFFILILAIFICAFSYAYFHLAQVNISLAQMVFDLKKQSTMNNDAMQSLHKEMENLQDGISKSESLSKQQEQMINDWQSAQKGNLNKWYVAEAQYLTKLADDNVQFDHNNSLALVLLQRAAQTLQNLSDTNTNLMDIQKSLATDITNLQATHTVDTTQLYLKLNALTKQINQLPLPVGPLKNTETKEKAADYSSLPWWQAGLYYSIDAIKKIVIIRYEGNQTLPLVLPEEKSFLYQNLLAQLENAMWALLHKNADVYQASLMRANLWVHQYFDQSSSQTQFVLQELQTLQAANIQPASINFSNTLQLFEHYFTQAEPTKTE